MPGAWLSVAAGIALFGVWMSRPATALKESNTPPADEPNARPLIGPTPEH